MLKSIFLLISLCFEIFHGAVIVRNSVEGGQMVGQNPNVINSYSRRGEINSENQNGNGLTLNRAVNLISVHEEKGQEHIRIVDNPDRNGTVKNKIEHHGKFQSFQSTLNPKSQIKHRKSAKNDKKQPDIPIKARERDEQTNIPIEDSQRAQVNQLSSQNQEQDSSFDQSTDLEQDQAPDDANIDSQSNYNSPVISPSEKSAEPNSFDSDSDLPDDDSASIASDNSESFASDNSENRDQFTSMEGSFEGQSSEGMSSPTSPGQGSGVSSESGLNQEGGYPSGSPGTNNNMYSSSFPHGGSPGMNQQAYPSTSQASTDPSMYNPTPNAGMGQQPYPSTPGIGMSQQPYPSTPGTGMGQQQYSPHPGAGISQPIYPSTPGTGIGQQPYPRPGTLMTQQYYPQPGIQGQIQPMLPPPYPGVSMPPVQPILPPTTIPPQNPTQIVVANSNSPIIDACPGEVESVGCFQMQGQAKAAFNEVLAQKTPQMTLEELFCLCGSLAEKKGYLSFGLSDNQCLSGANEGAYNSGGTSTQCFNEKGQVCSETDVYCIGDNTSMSVYSIITAKHRSILSSRKNKHNKF